MTFDIRKNFLFNDETDEKLKELVKQFSGDYPSESQAVRSAIHYLYNKKRSEMI